ncbi:MAG: DEAD/DEAH box helicase [Candidatus Diapherotrites archaeon]|nr:DEAD/DEAH box helicase [Candidatus Diapherotrites archaeon]
MNYVNHALLRRDVLQSREYQEILAARAEDKGNTLIVAPTALGKTAIAVLVAVNALEKHPDKKVLFLAPTKPLAAQHMKSFSEFTTIERTALFTGETPAKDRAGMWTESTVVFATPQTIQSTIFASQIDLSDVALLIVDEAHRAVGDYAYVFIADSFVRKSSGSILALTASPGGTREKIHEICQNLFIQNVEVRGEKDEDVQPYVNQKLVEWKTLELPVEFYEIKSLLETVMTNSLKNLKDMGFARNTSLKWYNRTNLLKMNQYLLRIKGKEPRAYKAISEVAALMKLYHAHELLETQGVEQLASYFEKLGKESTKASKRITSCLEIRKAVYLVSKMKAGGVDHPKLQALYEVLKDENGQAIVFTQYRSSAKRIDAFLSEKNVNSRVFIGQTTKEGMKGMRQKEQLERLQRFKDKEFQVLVCTSVGEEGLDIPSVDLVVFYEPVPSEIRKIQRAGRTGRHKEGRVVIFITKGTRDEAYYWSSRAKEKEMNKVLRNMSPNELSAEPQKTMAEFTEIRKGEKPVIFVDSRERASGIAKQLMGMEVELKQTQLPVGDYLVSDRVAVERKTCEDFVQSVIDGRLFQQAQELRANFRNPVMLLEGEDLYSVRNVHPNALRGALAAVAVDFGIPVLCTKNAEETAAMLVSLARREQEEKQRSIRLRGEKHAMADEDQQVFVVESLPNVGGTLARSLLKRFRTVERVFTASEEELKEVELVGDKKAKEIRRLLTKEYASDS